MIVGGGAAGLALAGRLSESTNTTVAVIEAGDDGSAVMERILVPACKSSFLSKFTLQSLFFFVSSDLPRR